MVVLKNTCCEESRPESTPPASRLGGRELGDGLRALGDGVLGELAGEDEAHGRLDLAGGERALGVDARKVAGLGCREGRGGGRR